MAATEDISCCRPLTLVLHPRRSFFVLFEKVGEMPSLKVTLVFAALVAGAYQCFSLDVMGCADVDVSGCSCRGTDDAVHPRTR